MPFVCGYMARIVNDTELKMTKNGKEMCPFTIANEEGWGDKKTVDYIRCTAWGNTAKTIVNHFPKGTPIIVEGQWRNNPFKKDERGYDIPNWTFNVFKIDFILKDKNDKAKPKDDVYIPYGESTTMGAVDSGNSSTDAEYFAPLSNSTDDLPF